MQLEHSLVDKQNNANHINLAFRRKSKKANKQERPSTSILQTTFNPLPKINRASIPSMPHIHHQLKTVDVENDLYEGLYPRSSRYPSKQGPVIARSSKLKSFFGTESDRYGQKKKLSDNWHQHRRGSLDVIREKIEAKERPISRTIETNNRLSKKEIFARLYQKQKREYDRVLLKYGITEEVQDQEYIKFMRA